MHRIGPAQLRGTVAVCLVLLGLTMPLYLVVYVTPQVDLLVTFHGLLAGIYMDALMTMAGMASVDPAQRQVDQAGFSFWVSTALILAPFTTGVVIGVLGITDIFALFAILAGVAALLLIPLRGARAVRNPNATFNASLIAAIGNKDEGEAAWGVARFLPGMPVDVLRRAIDLGNLYRVLRGLGAVGTTVRMVTDARYRYDEVRNDHPRTHNRPTCGRG